MRLSSLNRLSAPRDQRESVGIGLERYWEVEGSEGRAERMSLWIASMSTMELAQSTGLSRQVARKEAVSCSVAKTGWKFCGLTRA